MNSTDLRRFWLFLILSVASAVPHADNLLMGRVSLRADVVFEYVKSSIEEHGYGIAHLQLCDGGMTDFGYKTDFYRVVFFGKINEVRGISRDYPELVSFLPLKMAVIAEKDETLITVLNPQALAPFYTDQGLLIQFGRWENDLRSILDDVRREVAKRPKDLPLPPRRELTAYRQAPAAALVPGGE